MGSDFLLKISDIAQVFDGPHATPKKIDIGPYFLSISSLEDGQLDLSKSAHLSEEQFEKWTKRVTPQEGDVLFSYETRLGEAALMPKNVKACLGRRMGLLRPDRNKVLPEYLLYAYMAPAFQQEIKRRTIYGATVERISLRELPDFNIRIPDLTEQMQVVDILNALNGKIALNRQINQTLEQMAQTLFKSWFVDFDPVIDNALDAIANGQNIEIPESLAKRFEARKAVRESEGFEPLPADIRQLFPCEFEVSELSVGICGFVPKGWHLGYLSDVSKVLSGFAFKGKDFSDSGDAVIKIKNINSDRTVGIHDVQRVPSNIAKLNEKFLLKDGSLIMAMTGATVGKFGLLVTENNEQYFLNQRVAKFENSDEGCGFIYCALNQKVSEDYIVNAAQGSAQPNISAKGILDLPLIVPNKGVRLYFNNQVNDFFDKIIINRKQIFSLTKLRDTLLPKLISGELRLDSPQGEALQQVVNAE